MVLHSKVSRCVDVMGSRFIMLFKIFMFGRSGHPSDTNFDPEVHLTASDVGVDSHASPSYVAVRIKASKTDPFRQGVTIYLGKTDSHICPVAAILSYIVRRDSSPGLLFTFEDGCCLTRDCLSQL